MTEWSGKKDQGPRAPTEADRRRVRAEMGRHVGRAHAVLLEDLRLLVGVPSRTLRAVLSEDDGIDWVLAYTEDGAVYVAEWMEDAVGYNRHLHAQIATMQRRLDRRRAYTEQRLPRRQQTLFE